MLNVIWRKAWHRNCGK